MNWESETVIQYERKSEKSLGFFIFLLQNSTSWTQLFTYELLRLTPTQKRKLHARNSLVSGTPSHKHSFSVGLSPSASFCLPPHPTYLSLISKEIWLQALHSVTWPLAMYFHKYALMFNVNSITLPTKPLKQESALCFPFIEVFWIAHTSMLTLLK